MSISDLIIRHFFTDGNVRSLQRPTFANSVEDLEVGLEWAEYSSDSGLRACVDADSFPDILTSVVLSTKFN